MKKMLYLALALVLLAGYSIPRADAATITVSFNFSGATIGDSCVTVIDADPALIAGEDGPTAISNTNNAGGSAPECQMAYLTVIRIFPISGGIFTGVEFLYSGSFYVELYNSGTNTIVYSTNLSGQGLFTFSGAEFDDIYLAAKDAGSANYIDNGQITEKGPFTPSTPPPVVQAPGCDQAFPILSSALVTSHQPGYWKPGGDEIVLPDGSKLDVLHDVDGDGQDEFLVVARGTVGDERWVGLFIGACHPVYVPLAKVTLLRPLEW